MASATCLHCESLLPSEAVKCSECNAPVPTAQAAPRNDFTKAAFGNQGTVINDGSYHSQYHVHHYHSMPVREIPQVPPRPFLFQFLSIVLGVICGASMFPGIIPFFGLFQWAVLAGCVLGVIFGSFCQRKIGLTINIAVGLVALLRLFLGGGIL